jgi:dCMP deaminase
MRTILTNAIAQECPQCGHDFRLQAEPCMHNYKCPHPGTRTCLATEQRWHEYFLDMCVEQASFSKDPDTQVGSVIVGSDNKVRSVGFNRFPDGIEETYERLHNRDLKLSLIVHAELNAICYAAKHGIPLLGSTLYLTATDDTGLKWGGPPCSKCMPHVIQSGIKRIISRPPKLHSKWANDLAKSSELICETKINYKEISFDE